jgi:hypothetical protein
MELLRQALATLTSDPHDGGLSFAQAAIEVAIILSERGIRK